MASDTSDTSDTSKTSKAKSPKASDAAKATKKPSDGRGKKLTQGDRVTWHSHGSTTEGTVERKITRRTKAAGRTVDASPEEPQYEVRSAKSGRSAVHKPSALRKK